MWGVHKILAGGISACLERGVKLVGIVAFQWRGGGFIVVFPRMGYVSWSIWGDCIADAWRFLWYLAIGLGTMLS